MWIYLYNVGNVDISLHCKRCGYVFTLDEVCGHVFTLYVFTLLVYEV